MVDEFSKFGSFFQNPIEPWSQMESSDERLTGEKLTVTLGYLWDVKEGLISSTMELAVVSKKRGMSRNMQLNDDQHNAKLITKPGLAVLWASIVSTDGVLSVPLQLGAKLLLSKAAVISPGLDSWNKTLIDKDT